MIANENKQQTSLSRARSIIDACFIGGLPEDLDRRVLMWLIEGIESGRIDGVLLDKWLENITADEHPDLRVMLAFDLAMEQLGFPEDIRARLSDVRSGEHGVQRVAPVPAVSSPERGRPRPLLRLSMRVAAVIIPVVMIVGATWFLLDRHYAESRVAELVMSVEHGLQKQVTLSDNSEVWINSGSTLQYDGEVRNRRVARLSGEAYFKVAKSEKKPFIVKTEETEIRVTGTEFNVKESEAGDLTRIVLTEGTITVRAGGDTHSMTSGEWLEYNHLDGSVTKGVSEVEFPDWRATIQTLSGRLLGDIFRILCDYYGYELVVNGVLPASEYSVKFHGDDPIEQILHPLSISSGEFSYRVEQQRVIIDSI